jgi:hypothetical protein
MWETEIIYPYPSSQQCEIFGCNCIYMFSNGEKKNVNSKNRTSGHNKSMDTETLKI